MLFLQMCGLFCYTIANRHGKEKLLEMVKHANKAEVNDFLHDNSPYQANYIHPHLLATPNLDSNSSRSQEEDGNAQGVVQ